VKRFIPLIVVVVMASWIAGNWMPPKIARNDFNLAKFGKLPVLVGGRAKPLDTVARNSL